MRNQTVIRTLIREMLSESDRFSREMGRDFDVIKDRNLNFEAMAKEEIAPGVPRYYFNMSNDFTMTFGSQDEEIQQTPMATINPNPTYDCTPLAFYCYPLDIRQLRKFMAKPGQKNIPYNPGGDWFTIIEALSTDTLLNLGNPSDRKYYNDVQEKSYEISYDPDFKESSVMATMSHIFLKKTTLAPEHALPQARKIEWIYDPGTKTIYDEQPWQAAFLTSKSFTVIEKIRAKDVYESLHGNTISYSHVSGELTNHEKLLSTAEKTTDMNAYREIMKSRLGDVRTAGKKNPLFKKL